MAALLGLGLLAASPASAAGRAAIGGGSGGLGSLSLHKSECRLLGGEVDDFGGGEWSCCLDDACYNCRGESNSPANDHCDCYGDGCDDAAAKIRAGALHRIGGLQLRPGKNAVGANPDRATGPRRLPLPKQQVAREKPGGTGGPGFQEGGKCTVLGGPNKGEKGTFDGNDCCNEKDWGCTGCTDPSGKPNGKCKSGHSALFQRTHTFDRALRNQGLLRR